MNKNEIESNIMNSFQSVGEYRFDELMNAIESADDNNDVSFEDLVPTHKKSFNYKVYSSIAAVILLMVVCVALIRVNVLNTASVVSLDVNPGIAMNVDRNCCVKKIYGTNEDGKALLKKHKIEKKLSIDEAMNQIILLLKDDGYLNDKNYILVAIDSKNPEQFEGLNNQVEESLSNAFDSYHINDIQVVCRQANLKKNASAKESLKQELLKKDSDNTDIENMNIDELVDYANLNDETEDEAVDNSEEETTELMNNELTDETTEEVNLEDATEEMLTTEELDSSNDINVENEESQNSVSQSNDQDNKENINNKSNKKKNKKSSKKAKKKKSKKLKEKKVKSKEKTNNKQKKNVSQKDQKEKNSKAENEDNSNAQNKGKKNQNDTE